MTTTVVIDHWHNPNFPTQPIFYLFDTPGLADT
jgi:hypothetical protein